MRELHIEGPAIPTMMRLETSWIKVWETEADSFLHRGGAIQTAFLYFPPLLKIPPPSLSRSEPHRPSQARKAGNLLVHVHALVP